MNDVRFGASFLSGVLTAIGVHLAFLAYDRVVSRLIPEHA